MLKYAQLGVGKWMHVCFSLMLFVYCDFTALSLYCYVFLSLPSFRWWSVFLPSYFLMVLLFIPLLYFSYNLYHTLPLWEFNTFNDQWGSARRKESRARSKEKKIWQKQQREKKRNGGAQAENGGDDSPPPDLLPEPEDGYSVPDMVDLSLAQVNKLWHYDAAQQALIQYAIQHQPHGVSGHLRA